MSLCTRTLPWFFLVRSIPQDPGTTSGGDLTLRTHPGGGPPGRLLAISLAVASGFWGLAALRNALLQSNSFDLGLCDQWVWLISRGLARRPTLPRAPPMPPPGGDGGGGGAVAALDGLASERERWEPWRRIGWAAACWAALAKPWQKTPGSLPHHAKSAPGRGAHSYETEFPIKERCRGAEPLQGRRSFREAGRLGPSRRADLHSAECSWYRRSRILDPQRRESPATRSRRHAG